MKLSNSRAKAGPMSVAIASPESAYFWWVLLAFHALILIILNHNLIRPDLIRGSLTDEADHFFFDIFFIDNGIVANGLIEKSANNSRYFDIRYRCN